MQTSVDFPEPLGPRSATVSPASARRRGGPNREVPSNDGDVDAQPALVLPRIGPAGSRIAANAMLDRQHRDRERRFRVLSATVRRPRWRCRQNRPWRFPANVMMAPNSPKARPRPRTRPPRYADGASGPSQRRSTYHREAPSVDAASSSRCVQPAEAGLEGQDGEQERHERRGQHGRSGHERETAIRTARRATTRRSSPPVMPPRAGAGHDGRHHEGEGPRGRAPASCLGTTRVRAPARGGTPRTGASAAARIEATSDSRRALSAVSLPSTFEDGPTASGGTGRGWEDRRGARPAAASATNAAGVRRLGGEEPVFGEGLCPHRGRSRRSAARGQPPGIR